MTGHGLRTAALDGRGHEECPSFGQCVDKRKGFYIKGEVRHFYNVKIVLLFPKLTVYQEIIHSPASGSKPFFIPWKSKVKLIVGKCSMQYYIIVYYIILPFKCFFYT